MFMVCIRCQVMCAPLDLLRGEHSFVHAYPEFRRAAEAAAKEGWRSLRAIQIKPHSGFVRDVQGHSLGV